jgi:hypothetical protein
MSLLPRTTLHSGSEQTVKISSRRKFHLVIKNKITYKILFFCIGRSFKKLVIKSHYDIKEAQEYVKQIAPPSESFKQTFCNLTLVRVAEAHGTFMTLESSI